MPEPKEKKDYLELFDVLENSVIGTVPIDSVKLVPPTLLSNLGDSEGIPVNTGRSGGLRLFCVLKPAGWRFGFVASSRRVQRSPKIDITNEALCMPSRECVPEGQSGALSAPKGIRDYPLDNVNTGAVQDARVVHLMLGVDATFLPHVPGLKTKDRARARSDAQGRLRGRTLQGCGRQRDKRCRPSRDPTASELNDRNLKARKSASAI